MKGKAVCSNKENLAPTVGRSYAGGSFFYCTMEGWLKRGPKTKSRGSIRRRGIIGTRLPTRTYGQQYVAVLPHRRLAGIGVAAVIGSEYPTAVLGASARSATQDFINQGGVLTASRSETRQ